MEPTGPQYCPLCGAHEFEQEEGSSTDAEILKRREEIIALYNKLINLELNPPKPEQDHAEMR